MQRQVAGNRLGELLDAANIRPAEVAVHCDVDQSTIWRWRTGRSPIPDHQKVRLAQLLGVTIAELMGPEWTGGRA
jgi:transcriptional regulator with XRE-family HTH domain